MELDGGDGGTAVQRRRRWRRRRRDDNTEVPVVGARSGGGGSGKKACGSGESSWTPPLAFCEQPLEMEETPFFSQMTARVCAGVPSPLIEPKMGREGKGPT